jgi:hypothetical protein
MKQILLFVSCGFFLNSGFSQQSILDIDYKNPKNTALNRFPANIWPKKICGDAVWLPGSAPREWESILDADKSNSNSEIVGVTGNVFNPHVSTADVWFTHPFGMDFNYDVQWKANPNFDFLSSPRIKPDADEDNARINALQNGFNGDIHVEMDSAFVPLFYRPQAGNTVAVFGRWVVDCGHDNYQSEIHPPLMFVKATAPPAVGGGFYTEAAIISRPFMIKQDFDNGNSLLKHIQNETGKLITLAATTGPGAAGFHYTAIPNILKKSFSGTHLLAFNLRPPRKPKSNEQLFLTYHLTVRTGVTVAITDINDGLGTINVTVLLDELTYSYPALPAPITENIAIETLKKFDDRLKTALWIGQFGAAANPFVLIALEKGVTTQRYNIPVYPEPADVRLTMNQLRANSQAGIIVNDDQVYPIRGSMRVEWNSVAPSPSITPCSGRNLSPLVSNTPAINFFPNNLTKSQLITISNPTNTAIQLGKLNLTGTDSDKFRLESSSIIIVRGGGAQPPETCSNTVLPPQGSCQFRIAMAKNTIGHNFSAILNIPGGGPCPIQIKVQQLNGVQ